MMGDDFSQWRHLKRYTVRQAALLINDFPPQRSSPPPDERLETEQILKTAILNGDLPARRVLDVQMAARDVDDRPKQVAIDPDHHTVEAKQAIEQVLSARGLEGFVLDELNWEKTTILRSDLKDFVGWHPVPEFLREDQDPMLNPDHPRFAPELALAVRVWRALDENPPKHSVKKAARDWMDKNPDALEAGSSISNEQKDRVSIVVNWKRKGGATPTSE